jgi:Protein of unknown function (DUF732)
MGRRIVVGVVGLIVLAIPVPTWADPEPPYPGPPPGVHNLSEQKFLHDIATEGMKPSPPGPAGESNAISEGYVICDSLRGGYSRAWVTANAPTLPGLANLGAGSLPAHLRQLLVNAAWVDLCPQVPANS